MSKIYQEMGEMIEDIKDKITDNEYLVMYNKLRDIKKLHDRSTGARLGRRWADSSSDSSSDSSDSDSDSDEHEHVEAEIAERLIYSPMVTRDAVSEETVGQFRQDVEEWATRITTHRAAQQRMRRARRAMNPRCRCGSTTHQRVNHRSCPMNPSRRRRA